MRDAHSPPAFEEDRDYAEFLEAFLRDQVACLFDLAPDCSDIAAWIADESADSESTFAAMCEALECDPKVIRREILRAFHDRNLRRLAKRECDWERVRDWYLRETSDHFLEVMARFTDIPTTRLAQQAFDALSGLSDHADPLAGRSEFLSSVLNKEAA